MNEEKKLKSVERESFLELMQDGFTEILAGMIFLVFPAFFLEPGFLFIFVIFYIIFMPQVVEAIRRKYTYPRIGYVKLREGTPPKLTLEIPVAVLIIFVTIIAVLYIASMGVIDRLFIMKWMPAVFGFIMWGPSLYLKDKTGQNRYYLPGALMSLTGVVISLADFLPAELGTSIFMNGWGLAFTILGLVRFLLFIRKYPVAGSPEDARSEQ